MSYLAEHFEDLKGVFQHFDETESAAVKNCNSLFKNAVNYNNAVFIQNNYEFLVDSITRLESQRISLGDSLEILRSTEQKIAGIGGAIGKGVAAKIATVHMKNSGLGDLRKINEILTVPDRSDEFKIQDNDLTTSDCAYFKFGPISSCDVERSFSKYKNLATDKRLSLTVEHMRYLMIASVNCEDEF